MEFFTVLKYVLDFKLDFGFIIFKPVYFVYMWFIVTIFRVVFGGGSDD